MAIENFGPPEKLRAIDLEPPRPDGDEVLVRVVAAGVSLQDCRVRAGAWSALLPHELPLVPGFEVAGVVESFGARVDGYRKGDRVWGLVRRPTLRLGGYAELACVPVEGVGPMPARLLFEEAAPFPLAGLSAWQALFDVGGVGEASSVLVLGAGGGAGHLAVQLAAAEGARVIGTAPAAQHAFVLGLGAGAVVDPSAEGPAEAVGRHRPGGVDLVVDTVGGPEGAAALAALSPGGRLVSLVDAPDERAAAERGVEAGLLVADPSSAQLAELARRVDSGALRVHVERIFSLGAAAEAHALLEGGGVRGKLVLNL